MVKPSYQVDGMHFDTLDQADVVAERLFARYDKTRSITIYEVDHHGEKQVHRVLEAENDPEDLDTDTVDFIS